jgi:type I restriction-modification system DNA methylase subunit
MWWQFESYNGYEAPASEKKIKRKNGHEHTDEAIKQRGEVFTPNKLVKQMLGKLPESVFSDSTKTFLDNSCGNGQFLFAVMERKVWWLMKQDGQRAFNAHKQALKTTYGCELDADNAEQCRLRLLKGSTSQELRAIVDHNIITADALDPKHKGWKDVGFY